MCVRVLACGSGCGGGGACVCACAYAYAFWAWVWVCVCVYVCVVGTPHCVCACARSHMWGCWECVYCVCGLYIYIPCAPSHALCLRTLCDAHIHEHAHITPVPYRQLLCDCRAPTRVGALLPWGRPRCCHPHRPRDKHNRTREPFQERTQHVLIRHVSAHAGTCSCTLV